LIILCEYTRILLFRSVARFIGAWYRGNTVECGVNTGETAKYLNLFFQRERYIFLTHLKVLPRKILKNGWILDSFEGVEDTFSFVHLDMDLYKPMLAALEFFWDKVSIGGMICLHNYFHTELPSAKKAVADFEQSRGLQLSKISDSGGSIVKIKR